MFLTFKGQLDDKLSKIGMIDLQTKLFVQDCNLQTLPYRFLKLVESFKFEV